MVSGQAVACFMAGEICPASRLLLGIYFHPQQPQLRLRSPTHPISVRLKPRAPPCPDRSATSAPLGPQRDSWHMHLGAHLDQVHFAGAHKVKREPIKCAVVPVAVGRAGSGAGVESALERALPAHAATHAPGPACGAPPPLL